MSLLWPGNQAGAVFLIDKPTGPTSFDMIRKVRKSAQIKKVGHTGTLDPLASGVLVVCVGEGTKLVPYLMSGAKRYLAEVSLGSSTNTDDCQGETLARLDAEHVTAERVADTLPRFIGQIDQVPPQFAAIKQGGEPVYVKARRGEEVQLAARTVTIDNIDFVGFDQERKILTLRVDCGKGTYIRSLARDLGGALGTLGHLSALRRELNAGYSVDDPRLLPGDSNWGDAELTDKAISVAAAVEHLPGRVVTSQEQADLLFGRAIVARAEASSEALPSGATVRLLNEAGQLVAIAREASGDYQPVRVFAL